MAVIGEFQITNTWQDLGDLASLEDGTTYWFNVLGAQLLIRESSDGSIPDSDTLGQVLDPDDRVVAFTKTTDPVYVKIRFATQNKIATLYITESA